VLGLGLNRRTSQPPRRRGGDGIGVEDRRQIARILSRLCEDRCLLSVAVPGSGRAHVSTLLTIEPDHGFIAIDEPATASMAVGAPLEVSARIDGVLVRFSSHVRAHGTDSGGSLYRLDFPERVERHQRRAHHRAPVTQNLPVAVTFTLGEGSVTAEARDLSEGGLAARLPPDLAWPGSDGPIPCSVQLADSEMLECEFEVRRQHQQGNVTVLAGRFLGLTPKGTQALARFVAGLEREALRKRAD